MDTTVDAVAVDAAVVAAAASVVAAIAADGACAVVAVTW